MTVNEARQLACAAFNCEATDLTRETASGFDRRMFVLADAVIYPEGLKLLLACPNFKRQTLHVAYDIGVHNNATVYH